MVEISMNVSYTVLLVVVKFSQVQVEVRGFPNGIFNPWARWISGLALAKNSSAVVAVVIAL